MVIELKSAFPTLAPLAPLATLEFVVTVENRAFPTEAAHGCPTFPVELRTTPISTAEAFFTIVVVVRGRHIILQTAPIFSAHLRQATSKTRVEDLLKRFRTCSRAAIHQVTEGLAHRLGRIFIRMFAFVVVCGHLF